MRPAARSITLPIARVGVPPYRKRGSLAAAIAGARKLLAK